MNALDAPVSAATVPPKSCAMGHMDAPPPWYGRQYSLMSSADRSRSHGIAAPVMMASCRLNLNPQQAPIRADMAIMIIQTCMGEAT